MSYGYSLRLLELNESADTSNIGVRLGKLCIKKSIPVATISNVLGVSRQTVYYWFCGVYTPQNQTVHKIEQYIDLLEAD